MFLIYLNATIRFGTFTFSVIVFGKCDHMVPRRLYLQRLFVVEGRFASVSFSKMSWDKILGLSARLENQCP